SRETSETKSRETGETSGTKSRETSETKSRETNETSDTKSRETDETGDAKSRETTDPKVSSLEPRHAETQKLLDEMWSRGGADTVRLGTDKVPGEAEKITGRPKATAAKRLSAARDLYKAGRRRVIETGDETETEALTGTDN
ncbi:hypothetical protein, partial [Streptomyces sp. t99]|uniref:hypothetical protein n=1 Tax=Streptomyces sp. t99 TaxID=1828172 RepID=UPI001C54F35B